MARRRNNPDDAAVRGPTSALTSFLRDQGIVSRPRQREQQGEAQPPADEQPAPPVASTSRTVIDVSDDEQPVPPSSSKKRKKGKKDDDADGFELDFTGEKKARYADRKAGDIIKCVECNKRFTVTKYTKSLGDAGQICTACEKELGELGEDAKPAPKKKAIKARPKPAPLEKLKIEMPTLQENCIRIIGRCIEELDEDALGDIGGGNMERICKIVCKNRALTSQTVKLFLEIHQQELKLFDCSRIDDRGFTIICNLAPALRSLTLRYCGLLDDKVMDIFQTKLVHLRRLELYGPFLVRANKWKEYFDSLVGRDFEAFRLQQCPRFDMTCLHRLVENVPGLVDLQIADLVKLTDAGLRHIHALSSLRHLDISGAGADRLALTDEGVIPLLEAVGHNLESLILDHNEKLTDGVLTAGVLPHCRHLTKLSLKGLKEIFSSGITGLFSKWDNNPALTHLDLHRVVDLDDDALTAMLVHSGQALTYLDINSDDIITEAGLNTLATMAPKMEQLDVSFVRAMDDFVVKNLLDNMQGLKVLSVFGNNRVTDSCPRRPGLRMRGQEAQFDVREMD